MFKVFIVEDEEKSRKLLKMLILELNMGFEVVGEAGNGRTALDTPELSEADVILTDIRMPLMDGIEFAEKALQKNRKYRIIIVTAYDEFEYARKGIQIGVKDFILKPFKRAELAEALSKVKAELQAEQTAEDGNPLSLNLAGKVKEYIKENLSDPDLSLIKAAEKFYVNSSYLSRQFKKECDVTFGEYLMKARIDKAILYLENSSMKAYEIGERVGIPDSKYFGKCFKKITGVSIQEYRRKKV